MKTIRDKTDSVDFSSISFLVPGSEQAIALPPLPVPGARKGRLRPRAASRPLQRRANSNYSLSKAGAEDLLADLVASAKEEFHA